MSEIDWSRNPLIAESDLGRRWLQIQSDLGLAQNTVAYGRGLEEYLRFVRDSEIAPTKAGRENIAPYVRSLRARPGATRGKAISIDSKSTLSNATLQQRLIRGKPLSFWMWSKMVKQLARESAVDRFTTHTLRHLRLTDLARAGWDIHDIATFAGHRSIQTTH